MSWVDVAMVTAGGAGAVARWVIDSRARARHPVGFPAGLLAINVSGSLLLGILTGLVIWHAAPAALTRVAGTGFCGGYTTFSTASVDTVRLARAGRWRLAAANAAANPIASIAAAAVGLWLTRP